MKLDVFAMERMQSTYENQVELNLSESGVIPLRLAELVDDEAARTALFERELRYTQSNGTIPLRASIAAMYNDATPDCVQVTNGGSEANYITIWNLIDPGDEVILMVPNYMQTWGIARAFGGSVREWPLVEKGSPGRWTVDTDALSALVTPLTKLIVICNPNNPTGARFESADLERIAAVAESRGIWILSDEIYRGAERDGRETPTMWGRSSRVIVTSGLSKAYGLPGLRIGWLVGPPSAVASLWSYHDYTTIAPGALSDFLATRALEPGRRESLLRRTRSILNQNFPIVSGWLDSQTGLFTYVPPDAGAIVYVHYHQAVNSTWLVDRLRERKSVLIVPGDHFGMDRYLRIGFGEHPDYVEKGLNRLRDLMREAEREAEESVTAEARPTRS
jgi:aspartate/methionine/tyrosine aminotransferase